MKYVLFICTHNAGRSQMAQAFFERHAPQDVRAESAGSEPADEVWPSVVEVMREAGIDLAGRRPRKLTREQRHLIEQLAKVLPKEKFEPRPRADDAQDERNLFDRVKDMFG